ncbi:MAG: hypothetical protein ACPL7K_01915 [Armatimonadota bacterium]
MATHNLQYLLREPKSRPSRNRVLAQVLSRLPSQKALWVEIERKSARRAEKAA